MMDCGTGDKLNGRGGFVNSKPVGAQRKNHQSTRFGGGSRPESPANRSRSAVIEVVNQKVPKAQNTY
jgi:hypothetical protein